MKKLFLSIVGVCLLFLSCNQDIIENPEGDAFSFSNSSSQVSVTCEPDLEALELNLPDVVTAKTTAKPGENAYFDLEILDTNLAGIDIPAWCVDQDLSLDVEGPLEFAVYSSYETLPDGEFEFPENFDLVNWVLNQDYIGKTSPSGGTYTFGHIQYAIWLLVDDSVCVECRFLTDPVAEWNNDSDGNIAKAQEIVQAALADGEGFIPACGQKVGVILNPAGRQAIIITVDVPEKEIEEECFECEGKVTELELQYNGDETATIRVETKKEGENGSKVVFEGTVAAGDTFSFVGNDKKGTLGTEIKIFVNGKENTKIHTSCSQPIGPGLVSGDFEVISGSSREGGNLCPVDSTPGGDCDECEGKVTNLELQYNGDEPANIVVKTKKEGENGSKVVFEGNVTPGETFSFVGNDKKGTLGTEIKIYVNGNENTKIHTSCSQPIGPGLISGDFEVISGSSREGGELCPVDTPPNGGCDECKGGVTSFTVKYTGTSLVMLKVEHKDAVLFNAKIMPDQLITLSGSKDDGKFEENNLIFTLDGVVQNAPEHDPGKIHVSCSKPFYVGLPIGDSLVVTAGTSKDNGPICEGTPPTEPDCQECDGKVTRLDLKYNGGGSAFIEVVQKKDGLVAFTGNVNSGETFTFSGKDDKGTLGTEIIISVNGSVAQKIHTSCSVEIGAGSVFGNFTVIGGASRNGGELCPVNTPPSSAECDCDGKIVSMAVEYSGPNGATVTVGDDEDGNNSKTFTNVQTGDILNVTLGDIGNWWYWSVNGNVQGSIHTSCSDDILGNVDAEKSDFGNMGTYPNPEFGSNNGTFLVVMHTDDEGNTCTLDGYNVEVLPMDSPTSGSTECDCDGKIVKMSVKYDGPSGAVIVVTGDKGGSQTFTNVSKGAVITPTLGAVGNWWYYTVNGNLQASIHTSCSDDILGNVDASKSIFGDMGSYPDPADDDGNKNDGTFLVTSHTDEKGNTCSLTDGH
ncbi:DUF7467 domain-containing protein [Algibacter luteus]|uniref:DUF7467 domain-containing protein n=1 Tax=Algibacter luteus TaxID=1178825 RepID=UPI002599E4C2|nr:hypothetical protein [Algibacter luteus]WJJ95538.1 hypothetical protein O5O44_09915 [Algibacter luteus]